LDELLALRELDRGAIVERLGASPEQITPDVSYGSLGHVDRLTAPGAHPAHFFFRGDELALIYVPEDALHGVTPDQLGGPGERLRSRFGKDAALYVHADRGVAYTEENGAVVALEVFPPTTLDRYRDEIWWEPPGFIR
jgi:hypothetical protein